MCLARGCAIYEVHRTQADDRTEQPQLVCALLRKSITIRLIRLQNGGGRSQQIKCKMSSRRAVGYSFTSTTSWKDSQLEQKFIKKHSGADAECSLTTVDTLFSNKRWYFFLKKKYCLYNSWGGGTSARWLHTASAFPLGNDTILHATDLQLHVSPRQRSLSSRYRMTSA